MSATIVTMKWGVLYGPHYVNRLYWASKRNLNQDFRFVCFTDNPSGIVPEVECFPMIDLPLPEDWDTMQWPKLGVFRDNIAKLRGPCLFLDLDVIIVDSMDDLFEYEPGSFCISADWLATIKRWKFKWKNLPVCGNTSVFRFEANTLEYIVDEFESNFRQILQTCPNEQTFVTNMVSDKIKWWPTPWIRSFRRHCRPPKPLNLILRPTLPQSTKIVCFHGLPKMHEAVIGKCSEKFIDRCRTATWISDNWRDEAHITSDANQRSYTSV